MSESKKKKGLLEWVMLAIGLSYGDEGEQKWAKRRREIEESEKAAQRPPTPAEQPGNQRGS